MITNSGKNIIAKYLLGHTSSYASHIAVGCGATPLGPLDDPDSYAEVYETKDALDFEMFRIPITSRGYVREEGLTYVVLTAELPTTERYGMTEFGIYSAGSNPEAGVADSKLIKTFSDLENWEKHDQQGASEITKIVDALDVGDNVIDLDLVTGTEGVQFFRVNSDNPTLLYNDRIIRHEVPRFLDSSIVVRGDASLINVDENNSLVRDDTASSHIHLTGVSLNLDQNAPTDELRFAFSLINQYGQDPNDDEGEFNEPEEVRIIVEFASGEGGEDIQYAAMDIRLVNSVDGIDFSNNRYFVASQQLQELRKSIGFSWDRVTIIKVYVSVIGESFGRSDQFFVALDGLRIENKTDIHPLYALTGYTAIKNDDGVPIVKSSNSSSFVEFRFGFQLDQYQLGS